MPVWLPFGAPQWHPECDIGTDYSPAILMLQQHSGMISAIYDINQNVSVNQASNTVLENCSLGQHWPRWPAQGADPTAL